ncbi:hypothetical protein HDV00_012204 [Rhizophlyctis rosea]|nr:hypothetical protein HDV00_012204 [Rhizophlyctis rosea]
MSGPLFVAPDYLRGMVMGIFVVLFAQAFLIYRYVLPLFDPTRRFIPPSEGDRPSFAKNFPPGINDASRVSGTSAPGEVRAGDQEVNEMAKSLAEKEKDGAAEKELDKKDKEKDTPRTQPIQEHVEPWPENIVRFLKNALTPDEGDKPLPPPPSTDKVRSQRTADELSSPAAASPHFRNEPVAVGPTEPSHWVNVAVQRFFLALRGSELFKTKFKNNTNEKINLKLKGNSFVLAEVDLTYEGGASIAIETTLPGGLKLPVRVYLSALSGRVRVRCPSTRYADMIGIAFVEDPGATFRVDSPITVRGSEYVRDMVNKLLASVVRKVFLEMWVLPSWRTFFMPLMTPKLEDVLAREQAAKAAAASASSSASSTDKKSTTSRLWESRGAPLLRRSNSASTFSGDILSGKAFPITQRVSLTLPEADKLEGTLVPSFLTLAREADGDAKGEVKPISAAAPSPVAGETSGGSAGGSSPATGLELE